MAPPIQTGIKNFAVPTSLFSQTAVSSVTGKYGSLAEIILMKLLVKIYGENGYYIDWNDVTAYAVKTEIKGIEVDIPTINSIVMGFVDSDFFDGKKFDEYSILTSGRIQSNYLIVKRRSKITELIKPEYRVFATETDDDNPFPTPTEVLSIVQYWNQIFEGTEAEVKDLILSENFRNRIYTVLKRHSLSEIQQAIRAAREDDFGWTLWILCNPEKDNIKQVLTRKKKYNTTVAIPTKEQYEIAEYKLGADYKQMF